MKTNRVKDGILFREEGRVCDDCDLYIPKCSIICSGCDIADEEEGDFQRLSRPESFKSKKVIGLNDTLVEE